MAGNKRTFDESFCRRVKELRDLRGWTQEQMAMALGIPLDRYKKYEVRSPMPAYLVEPFALFVGRDIAFVMTGKTAPRRSPPAPKSPTTSRKGQKRGAA